MPIKLIETEIELRGERVIEINFKKLKYNTKHLSRAALWQQMVTEAQNWDLNWGGANA